MPERKGKRRSEPDTRAVDDVLPSDESEQAALGARLKESREYIGLLQEDVATALGIPRTSVHALEAGKRKVTGLELRRLARLYRRPVGWLLGEEDAGLNEAEPLFRAAAALSESDREQVLRFAEFLAAAGKPGASGRRAGRANPAGDLLQHGRQRIIYCVSLVTNLLHYLIGLDTEPAYRFRSNVAGDTAKVVAWWAERWLDRRLSSDEVLTRVESHRALDGSGSHGARVEVTA